MMHTAPVRSVRRPLLLAGLLFAAAAIADVPGSMPNTGIDGEMTTASATDVPSSVHLLAASEEAATVTSRKRRPMPKEVDGKYWGGGVWKNGCVDCHNDDTDGGYVSLGVLLQRVGHGIPPNHVKTVPNGCRKCHKDNGAAYPLATLIHEIHFEDPEHNAFVQDFDGSCIGCHRMNTDRGAVSIKRGPRNW